MDSSINIKIAEVFQPKPPLMPCPGSSPWLCPTTTWSPWSPSCWPGWRRRRPPDETPRVPMVCCRPGRRKGIDQPSTFYHFFLSPANIFLSPHDKNPYNAMVDRLDRKRTSIAAPEKRSLEAYFAVQPRPSGEKIAAIAEKLDLKKNVVRVWFCNQRQKQKRMKFAAQGGIH